MDRISDKAGQGELIETLIRRGSYLIRKGDESEELVLDSVAQSESWVTPMLVAVATVLPLMYLALQEEQERWLEMNTIAALALAALLGNLFLFVLWSMNKEYLIVDLAHREIRRFRKTVFKTSESKVELFENILSVDVRPHLMQVSNRTSEWHYWVEMRTGPQQHTPLLWGPELKDCELANQLGEALASLLESDFRKSTPESPLAF